MPMPLTQMLCSRDLWICVVILLECYPMGSCVGSLVSNVVNLYETESNGKPLDQCRNYPHKES